MDWWIVAAVIAAAFILIDWIIVMGINPKNRKGGGRHDRGPGAGR